MNIHHPRPEVMQTDLGDELVLVDGRSGHSFRLNASARVAWMSLPTTGQALGMRLIETFGIDSNQAMKDADAVLESLRAQDLVLIRTE